MRHWKHAVAGALTLAFGYWLVTGFGVGAVGEIAVRSGILAAGIAGVWAWANGY